MTKHKKTKVFCICLYDRCNHVGYRDKKKLQKTASLLGFIPVYCRKCSSSNVMLFDINKKSKLVFLNKGKIKSNYLLMQKHFNNN